MSDTPPIVLVFAASDPSGGGGMQSDILTLASMGCHALTVTGNTGHKAMALYTGQPTEGHPPIPNIRFYADIVYTNTPPAGAFRGYGVPQGAFAVDVHMERIARELGLDPIEFRLKT